MASVEQSSPNDLKDSDPQSKQSLLNSILVLRGNYTGTGSQIHLKKKNSNLAYFRHALETDGYNSKIS